MMLDATALYKMGLRIRELRIRRGMKQEELARVLEVSTAQMSHIERGAREPSLQTMVTLAEFMDVTIDYLVSGKIPGYENTEIEYLVLKEAENKIAMEIEAGMQTLA